MVRRHRVFKGIAFVLAAVVLIAALHSLLVVFPQPLFRHKVAYLDFTVRSTRVIPGEIYAILDRVHDRLSESDLYQDGLHHRVYLCNSYRLMRFLLIRNVHFGAILVTGDTFITDSDVVNDLARCKLISADDSRQRTLSGAITHEITHRLIRNRVGFWGNRRIPTWIKEGYCDYIGRDSAIDPEPGMAVLKGYVAPMPGFASFHARLMVAYLMDERGMAIGEILAQPPDYHRTVAELDALLRKDEEQVLEYLD